MKRQINWFQLDIEISSPASWHTSHRIIIDMTLITDPKPYSSLRYLNNFFCATIVHFEQNYSNKNVQQSCIMTDLRLFFHLGLSYHYGHSSQCSKMAYSSKEKQEMT